jgi:torulene dioxygenase
MNISDTTKPVMEIIEYHPTDTTNFFVLDKDTGHHLATYSAPNFMFFHSVNAYDIPSPSSPHETDIHVDLCAYEGDYCPYREHSLSNILDPARPFTDGTLIRYELSSVESASPIPGHESRVTVKAGIPGIAMEPVSHQ